MQGVDADMEINVLRGAILLTLMISFVGLWICAWRRKRKPAFHEASMLPLDDDNGQIPSHMGPARGKGSERC